MVSVFVALIFFSVSSSCARSGTIATDTARTSARPIPLFAGFIRASWLMEWSQRRRAEQVSERKHHVGDLGGANEAVDPRDATHRRDGGGREAPHGTSLGVRLANVSESDDQLGEDGRGQEAGPLWDAARASRQRDPVRARLPQLVDLRDDQ